MAKINEIDITSLTFQEGSAPTTPASTKWKIYTKTDGLYYIDDAGTETGPLGTGGGGGGLTLLDSSKLGADTANIEMTSFSGSGQHLRVIGLLRSDRVATLDELNVRLGGSGTIDTGSNYHWHSEWRGSANSGAAGTGAAYMQARNAMAAASADASVFMALDIIIPDYKDTGREKQVRLDGAVFAATGTYIWSVMNGIWQSTAAVDSIRVYSNTGSTNLVTGSELWVYDF